MRLFSDPALFNYVIMVMYATSAIRWASAGKNIKGELNHGSYD